MDTVGVPGNAVAWDEILRAWRTDESQQLAMLRRRLALSTTQRQRVVERARAFAAAVRDASPHTLRAESFLNRYKLSSREGVVLMCLAEALLRIPDAATADALIRDKLAGGRWRTRGDGDLLMNAASWALMLTGRLAEWHDAEGSPESVLERLVARAGEPMVRAAVRHALEMMAGQFIAGQSIDEAMDRARRRGDLRYSFDMLGEAARTAADSDRYFSEYQAAIAAVAAEAPRHACVEERPGISIKLSALHPRFEPSKHRRIQEELLPRLRSLCGEAAEAGIPVTIDAEESDRLMPTLEMFAALAHDPALAGWSGLGIAVQAYQKRALAVCDWLSALASASGRRLMVRLVKGAYWDTEIKLAQVAGLDYPVFTRKAATDLSYMVCAQVLLAAGEGLYPQFATHNCHSAAFILDCAGARHDFEFQKLHRMGDVLHEALLAEGGAACRVYAPVGSHRDLLAYLVRRMLENGANTSFVHQVADASIPIERLTADPLDLLPEPWTPNPRVPRPEELYSGWRNSRGIDLSDSRVLTRLERRIADERGAPCSVSDSSGLDVDRAVRAAQDACPGWNATPVARRAEILERAADLIESSADALVSLLVREGGKTFGDCVGEIREAADYCRYYAARARGIFGAPVRLPGPTGESNRMHWAGRGVIACISPWNFPLAIFTGQVSAALAAGNAVVAKPAEQTPYVAAQAVRILHQAGVPAEVLHLVSGAGQTVGSALVAHPGISGVAFTGSLETAKAIHRSLASREGSILPLVAETGGVNAMVADSSALPEQLVADIVASAFASAGQRCSALRVLLLQEDAAPRVLEMLGGAVAQLRVGDPAHADTDVGPVIDAQARRELEAHIGRLDRSARKIAQAPGPQGASIGNFVPPVAYEITLEALPRIEIFGPVLHVLRYPVQELDRYLEAMAGTGYGLTLGIHSRIDGFVERVRGRIGAGNTYVNRSMIGAVVGVQPFGGEGLSGTGPKGGGPNYLQRFAVERVLTVNTAAAGGNIDLFAADQPG